MKLVWGRIGLSGSALLVFSGCTGPGPLTPAAWRTEPVLRVTQSVAAGNAYYLTGRYYDGMQDFAHAVEAYRKSIAADAQNVEAHNALGVALAQLGQYDASEGALRRALVLAPQRAHVRSNLGYVLLITGRTREAALELETAVSLDASDTIARSNLDQALALLAGGRSAPVAAAPAPLAAPPSAATPESPPATVIAALALPDATPTVASIEAPVSPAPAAALSSWRPNDQPTVAAWPSTNNPASWTRVAAAPVVPAESTPVATAQAAEATARLELSNGGGITGAAARMRKWLALQGITTHRLTNQRPYEQRYTVIQYRSGQEEAAKRVAQLLPAGTETLAVSALRTDVRVLLGRDWHTVAACLEHGECGASARVAQASDSVNR